MTWIDNLWDQHEQNERHEIMITDLPEYFKDDFEIWTAFDKYLKNSDSSLENIEWCKIYHIIIPCNYDYKKKKNSKKIKDGLKWMAFRDIEKFKEYTSLYNLLKWQISVKQDFNDIDIIIIEDNKNTWIHIPIPVPWKLTVKAVKSGIKYYIKSVLHQPFWIDNKSYKKLIDDYTNEIYDIFRTNNLTEKRAKLENLKAKKPDVVTIRNSIKRKSNGLSYHRCPSSWSYRYYEELKKMRQNNTVYEVKF